MRMELKIKLLLIVTVLLFRIEIIHAVREPLLSTATPRPPDESTTAVTNGIRTTNAATPPVSEEHNDTETNESPTTTRPVEISSTTAAVSDQGLNSTDTSTSGSPTMSTKSTPFVEINSTDIDDEFNATATTNANTVPEQINSSDITTTDEFNITDTSAISEVVTEITTPSNGARSEAASESQGNTTTIEQVDRSSRSVLYGITLSGVVVASTLGGLTCLVICIVASGMIAFKVYRQNIHRRQKVERERVSATNFLAVYVPWPEVEVTRNPAYRTGQQVSTEGNAYSPRPSNGAVVSRSNQPKPMLPPRRYARISSGQIDASMDSYGYVKLPRPFV